MYFTLIILFLFILLLLFLFILLLLFLLNLLRFIYCSYYSLFYFILLRFTSCGRDEGWRRAVGHDAWAKEGHRGGAEEGI